MRRARLLAGLLLCLVAAPAAGQPAERFVLGSGGRSWEGGGGGIDPTLLERVRSRVSEDTTNAPGDAIDFTGRPGSTGARCAFSSAGNARVPQVAQLGSGSASARW